jgi:hypothetical protein
MCSSSRPADRTPAHAFMTAIDRREIGRKVADYWQDEMQRMVKVADDVSFPLRSRLAHAQYRTLVSNPIGTIAQIYNAFGLEFFASGAGGNVG